MTSSRLLLILSGRCFDFTLRRGLIPAGPCDGSRNRAQPSGHGPELRKRNHEGTLDKPGFHRGGLEAARLQRTATSIRSTGDF